MTQMEQIQEAVDMNVRMGMEKAAAEKLIICSILSDAQETLGSDTSNDLINLAKQIIIEGLA